MNFEYVGEPAMMLIIGVALFIGFRGGVSWERDRPNRELRDALRHGELLAALQEQAWSELEQTKNRIETPDRVTQQLIAELVEARDGVNSFTHTLASGQQWDQAVERLHEAKRAVSSDRKRYVMKLTEEEKDRLIRMGISHPALENPDAAGHLK